MKESNFRFKKPELVSLLFEVDNNFNVDEFCGISVLSKTNIQKHKLKNSASVILELIVGDKKSAPFYIEITMKSDFEWGGSLSDDISQELLKTNAPSLLLSYMRPIISMITSNSKYPTFNLPFMDMTCNNDIEINDI